MTTQLIIETATCERCGGSGNLPEFGHVHGGACFKCSGTGTVTTPAGRAARKLYDELVDAACTRKQAWEVEVGEVVSYVGSARRWFTVLAKDFSSTSGMVVDGQQLGSAVLTSKRSQHMVTPDTEMLLRPAASVLMGIVAEVARRRKGATLREVAV